MKCYRTKIVKTRGNIAFNSDSSCHYIFVLGFQDSEPIQCDIKFLWIGSESTCRWIHILFCLQ